MVSYKDQPFIFSLVHLLIAWYVIKTYENYQINKTTWGIHQMQNFTYANTLHEGLSFAH
jgi:hypothetical protein